MRFEARQVVPGRGQGPAITTTTPLSFWGGMDAETGEIIDRSHPLSGQCVTGKVLALPHGWGSCSGSGVILESIRHHTAPAAIVTTRVDPIIALGSILGDELYGRPIPMLVVPEDVFADLRDDDDLEVTADGGLVRHGSLIAGRGLESN